MSKVQNRAQLVLLRRSLTSFLLTLPIVTDEMRVDSLVELIDHLIKYPDDYTGIANDRKETTKFHNDVD